MRKYLPHTLFWLTIYLVWTYIRTGESCDYSLFLKVNLVQVSMYMIAYYVLKHVQIPMLFDKGKKVLFGLSLLVISVFIYLYWRWMGVLWIDDLMGHPNNEFWSNGEFLLQIVQVYSPAMILLAWETYNDRLKELERMEQLEKEKIANELKFLKAQINPHFLFNTLNNLYSNVITKSPKAPDMVMQLSGILDYVLYKSQSKTVPLREEVKTIENFLGLEKIRYGKRLEVQYQKGQNMNLSVSPLILLSLVENAFKHGASSDIDNPKITIDIREQQDEIHCEVWNTKSKYNGEINDAYKKGIGMKNIRRQLDLIYPDSHELLIEDNRDSYKVMLTIKPASA